MAESVSTAPRSDDTAAAMKRITPIAFVFIAALGGACTSTTSNTAGPRVVSGPFTTELAAFFDDAVDYVENVEELGGRVASEWRRQLDGLANNADIIAVVRVETITSGSESSTAGSYRLTAVATRDPIRGTLPNDRRLDVSASEGEVGYNTIRSGTSRLQARDWLMFVRWYEDSDGQVRPHWHLTPATEQALQRARDAIGYVDPNAPREQVARPVTN